jgi:hypothetical protein
MCCDVSKLSHSVQCTSTHVPRDRNILWVVCTGSAVIAGLQRLLSLLAAHQLCSAACCTAGLASQHADDDEHAQRQVIRCCLSWLNSHTMRLCGCCVWCVGACQCRRTCVCSSAALLCVLVRDCLLCVHVRVPVLESVFWSNKQLYLQACHAFLLPRLHLWLARVLAAWLVCAWTGIWYAYV